MKILKWLVILLGGLFALVLIGELILPSTYRVERHIVINAPVDSVFAAVVNLHELKKWNPWSVREPQALNNITGSGYEVGSTWSWSGEKIGKGSQTITEIHKNQSIKAHLRFEETRTIESDLEWQFIPQGRATKVIWANYGKLDMPLGQYYGLFLDGMLGPDFEEGLQNLKRYVEVGVLPQPASPTN